MEHTGGMAAECAVKQDHNKVLLFRSPKEGESDSFEKELVTNHFRAFSVPVLQFNFINVDELSASVSCSERYSAIVFTSQRAVEAVALALRDLEEKVTRNVNVKKRCVELTCYVVGASTRKAAAGAGFCPVECNAGNAEKLAEFIINDLKSKEKAILYPCGNLRKDTLSERLKHSGFCLKEIEAYETVKNISIRSMVEELIDREGLPEYVVYFSPSGILYTEDVVSTGLLPLKQLKVVALGPTTEKELDARNIAVHGVAPTPTPSGLLQAISSRII